MRSFLFVMIGIGTAVVASEGIAQDRTTACDLARHTRKHLSHRVEVFGEIRGGLDRLVLSDYSCPGKPVMISISNEFANHPDVAPFWSAIYREGSIGTVGKHITATVIGTYSHKRGDWPGGVLSVEGVRDLNVELLPAGS